LIDLKETKKNGTVLILRKTNRRQNIETDNAKESATDEKEGSRCSWKQEKKYLEERQKALEEKRKSCSRS
jgi:hypothetical protein